MDEELRPIIEDEITVDLEDLTKEVAKEVRADSAQVTAALYKFESSFQEYKRLDDLRKSVKQKGASLANASLFKWQRAQEAAYKDFFDFQNKFNSYFGQKITMTYIFQSADGGFHLGLFDNDMSHVARGAYSRLTYQINNINKIFQYDMNEYNADILNNTFREVLYRWGVALSTHKKKVWLPLLWKMGGWAGVKVNNQGTLAEAYANFYINKVTFNGSMEQKVANFILNKEHGAMSVDNTSGFAIGDINKGNVQFAVKKNKSGLMGMAQVYNIIQQLKVQLGIIDDTFLTTLYDEITKQGKAKQVAQLTSVKISKDFEKMLNEYFSNNKTYPINLLT